MSVNERHERLISKNLISICRHKRSGNIGGLVVNLFEIFLIIVL